MKVGSGIRDEKRKIVVKWRKYDGIKKKRKKKKVAKIKRPWIFKLVKSNNVTRIKFLHKDQTRKVKKQKTPVWRFGFEDPFTQITCQNSRRDQPH